jgi:hypothetical protein
MFDCFIVLNELYQLVVLFDPVHDIESKTCHALIKSFVTLYVLTFSVLRQSISVWTFVERFRNRLNQILNSWKKESIVHHMTYKTFRLKRKINAEECTALCWDGLIKNNDLISAISSIGSFFLTWEERKVESKHHCNYWITGTSENLIILLLQFFHK